MNDNIFLKKAIATASVPRVATRLVIAVFLTIRKCVFGYLNTATRWTLSVPGNKMYTMKLVRYFLLLFLFVFTYITVLGQLPDGFNKAGIMFRDSNSTSGLKYILLDPSVLSQNIKASKVILKKSLYTAPKQTDLTIEIFNIFFDESSLAVFSVMPSLHIQNPEWKKININSIKSQVITLSELKDTINSKLDSYPVKDRGIIDPLKYYNYVLVIKKADGYYFNTTDCITEFFKIVKSTNNNPAAFKIDTN